MRIVFEEVSVLLDLLFTGALSADAGASAETSAMVLFLPMTTLATLAAPLSLSLNKMAYLERCAAGSYRAEVKQAWCSYRAKCVEEQHLRIRATIRYAKWV